MDPNALSELLRPVTYEQALSSYHQLKYSKMKTSGLKTLDRHFLSVRLQTKTSKAKNKISFFEAVGTDELLSLVKKYTKYREDPANLKNQYRVFQLWYGSVNQFKPQIAQSVYERFRPTSILDFSAGWGGRALGAMSLGIPYIGIDSNKQLEPCYRALLQYEPTATLQMIFQPSETVDFSKFNYDMIFTSPPYYTQEKYMEMPEYPTLQDFLETFLCPVILKAWEHLSVSGVMCLNLPDWLYNRALIYLNSLPPLEERIPMPYQNRNGGIKHEWIYVWRKN